MKAKKMKAKKKPRVAGRPAGSDSTRSTILESARNAFGTKGYNGASIRGIAADAGVDPSTVIHFFGTKEGLFGAVIQDVAPATQPLLDAFRQQARGAELVRAYLEIWEDEQAGAAMRAIVRTAMGSERAMEMLKASMLRKVLKATASASGGALEAELAVMQLISLGLGRHIARLPELSGSDVNTIAQRVGPVLDQYLWTSAPGSAG